MTWSLTLTPIGRATRLHLRVRLGPIRHRRTVNTVGDLFDALTIAGMAAGLAERLKEQRAG